MTAVVLLRCAGDIFGTPDRDSEAGLDLQRSASSGLPPLAMCASSACNVAFCHGLSLTVLTLCH
jgi:hypothetical protein